MFDVTLLSYTKDPVKTLREVWLAAKSNSPLHVIQEEFDEDNALELAKKLMQAAVPVVENISFIFLLENIPISFREQLVRHKIGVHVGDRHGADIVPDLADSSWWSQCLAPDTKIPLLDGTTVAISDLCTQEEFFVYSVDSNGDYCPGRGHSARVTGRDVKTLCVGLDNGEEIICTPEHLFLLRSGVYKAAKDLNSGDSIWPLRRQVRKGYEQVYCPNEHHWRATHKLMAGAPPEGEENYVVHHMDFNKLNNSPENLFWCTASEHASFHQSLGRSNMAKQRKDPEFLRKLYKGARNALPRSMHSEEGKFNNYLALLDIDPKLRSEIARNASNVRWATTGLTKKHRLALQKTGRTVGVANLKRFQKSNIICKFCGEPMRGSKYPSHRRWNCVGAILSEGGNNHKVSFVKEGPILPEVWDITVDKYQNFALEAGIIVHNSHRILDMSKFADEKRYFIPEAIQNDPAALARFKGTMDLIQESYSTLVRLGIPMEQARELLPLGTTHRVTWCTNLAALIHIVGKRSCWILQSGYWFPIIQGMVHELADKVDPVFADLVNPPCIKNDKFNDCVQKLDNERRVDGRDSLPICPLYLQHHHRVLTVKEAKNYPVNPEVKKWGDFWRRDPWTGDRVSE